MSELIDNRARRIRTLAEIIRGLHEGQEPQEVKARLRELVRECDAGEIAAMEQTLIEQGVPVQEILGMCDLHSQVMREIVADRPHEELVPGHPADVFRRENAAVSERIAVLREAIAALGEGAVPAGAVRALRGTFNELMDLDKHYTRKEQLLFPFLEKHGITGPSKVMWAKDDQVRELLRGLGQALGAAEGGPEPIRQAAEAALAAVEEMISKEERILIPMALQTLNASEWGEIWEQSPEIGWCLIDPDGSYRPPSVAGPEIPADVAEQADREGAALHLVRPKRRDDRPARGALVFPTGSLELEQLRAIFSLLPVDLTFVDAEDRVRFFTEGRKRVFMRPKAVIGRKVQHCHPPSSVDVVDRIVDDFRAGRQDVAEFWIELRGQFVHIRYFAVRDADGAYMGTLEVTQDLTHERALEGERRLLQY